MLQNFSLTKRLALCELNSKIPPACLWPKLVSLLDCFFKHFLLQGILSTCFFLSKTLFDSKLSVIANGIMSLLSPSLTFQNLFTDFICDHWRHLNVFGLQLIQSKRLSGWHLCRKKDIFFIFYFFASIKYFSSQNRLWDSL